MPENEKQTNKERLKDITDSIERGIEDLFQSDKYAEYLRTMSRFHKYSVNNTMLIYMQKPDATLVAGFNKWRDQFARNVMKGEKGIKIIAPTPFKKKIEQEKRDPDTNLPMLDADGKVIVEEKEIKIPMFKPVTVFDVSQTDGKPLPQLASDLQGNVQNYEVFMEALRRSSPVPIEIIPIHDGADGYFSLDKQSITIREGMSEVQTVSAVVHEIAHSKLHNDKKIEEPKDAPKYQEVEIFDVSGLFSNSRLTAADVPEGMYVYDLRGSDDDPGQPITVESHVTVNYAGSIITAKPLNLGEEGRLNFTEEEGLNFVGGEISAYRFYNERRKDRNTEEVEAESISFAVCAYYGIATGENSFGYIATWSKDKELKELRASLETINSTSSELITDIDHHYAEIMKEREAEVIIVPETPVEKTVVETATANFIEEIAREVQEGTPVQAPDNGYMPDPSMSIEAMNAYGYTDENMLPLSKERALELMERDVPVYMLYDDNSEAMAFEPEDIQMFSGMLGVERTDWEQVRDEIPPMNDALLRQKMEQVFRNCQSDSFAIYQLKHDDSTANIRFMDSEWMQKQGLEPDKRNYEVVYTGMLTPFEIRVDTLEALYQTFNVDHPADFRGHSLSVSDIVALKEQGVVSYHYVDNIGYKELPYFDKNYLRVTEMQMEDDYGMIDGIVNNGAKQPDKLEKKPPVIAANDRSKRPSVLAKLRKYQAEDKQAVTKHRSAERD